MTQSLVPALIVTTMVLAVAAEAQQPRRSPLFSTVGTGEYLGETYVRRGPRGLFVFFVGEPVKIRITVANGGRSAETVSFAGVTPDQVLSVNSSRDGVPVDVAFEVGAGSVLGERRRPLDPLTATSLRPGDRIEWVAQVQGQLAPGEYSIAMKTTMVDAAGEPITARFWTYEFEVRLPSNRPEPEVIHRDALRRIAAGTDDDLRAAEGLAAQLLRLNPNSYSAFLLRGEIARRRGDEGDALANFARAVQIVKTDRDHWLTASKYPAERAALATTLEKVISGKRE